MAIPALPPVLLYRLDRLRVEVGAWIAHTANVGLFIGVALLLGIGSSWYMIEVGTALTTVRQGPWTAWTNAATNNLDPYTRAHYARRGSLPLSASIAATYEARYDDDGHRLHSSCEYLLESPPLEASWWSLAAYDSGGLLIPNPADRHVFTSETYAPNPDGGFYIVLARDARPGNWLPVGGAGRLNLVLTLVEPRSAPAAGDPFAEVRRGPLPAIKRISCR